MAEEFEVEGILGFYTDGTNRRYLVIWKRYGLSESTFEPEENVADWLTQNPHIEVAEIPDEYWYGPKPPSVAGLQRPYNHFDFNYGRIDRLRVSKFGLAPSGRKGHHAYVEVLPFSQALWLPVDPVERPEPKRLIERLTELSVDSDASTELKRQANMALTHYSSPPRRDSEDEDYSQSGSPPPSKVRRVNSGGRRTTKRGRRNKKKRKRKRPAPPSPVLVSSASSASEDDIVVQSSPESTRTRRHRRRRTKKKKKRRKKSLPGRQYPTERPYAFHSVNLKILRSEDEDLADDIRVTFEHDDMEGRTKSSYQELFKAAPKQALGVMREVVCRLTLASDRYQDKRYLKIPLLEDIDEEIEDNDEQELDAEEDGDEGN